MIHIAHVARKSRIMFCASSQRLGKKTRQSKISRKKKARRLEKGRSLPQARRRRGRQERTCIKTCHSRLLSSPSQRRRRMSVQRLQPPTNASDPSLALALSPSPGRSSTVAQGNTERIASGFLRKKSASIPILTASFELRGSSRSPPSSAPFVYLVRPPSTYDR